MQRSRDSIVPSLRSFIDSPRAGVIESCYGELVRAVPAHCTLLVFLNPGMDAYLANNLKRPWESHKYASLDIETKCLASFRSGWRIIINEKMHGHTGSIVKSSMPSQVPRWSIVRSMRMQPNNRLPEYWSKFLLAQPETGMDYQIVAVSLRGWSRRSRCCHRSPFSRC